MSPTSSPSSSADSPPDSSPADTTFSASDVTFAAPVVRPSFVPLTFTPLSRLPPSANAGSYRSSRTRKSLSLSPPTQHLTLSEATTAVRHDEEFDYDNSVKEDEPETVQGASSHHQTGKKKRTRTLTTPHQSAVLHALLAQSRFPTTAMREEVGRAIGLSARKVQVWFQNQRQKARKPRSQGRSASVDPSLPSGSVPPPQFGPFNPIPMSSSVSESIPVSSMGSSLSTDLPRKSSVYDEELSPFNSPSLTRGIPMSLSALGPDERASSSIESEFHMGAAASLTQPSVPMSTYSEQRQLHHPDHHMSGGQPRNRDISQASLHGHKESTALQQSFSYYSPSILRSVNPNPSQSPVYPFTVLTGGLRGEEEKPTRILESFSPDPPIILPPLRMNNDSGSSSSSTYNARGSVMNPESSGAIIRPDPQLRYSASFPSYSQDTGILRSSPSSFIRSSASSLPPPFTLQPRPQWDWDKPLGPVLPSIGRSPTTGDVDIVGSSVFRQPQQQSSFPYRTSRPRTTSDPAPPVETRQSALLTEPWPLPPVRVDDQSQAQVQPAVAVERQQSTQGLQHDIASVTPISGVKGSSETQIFLSHTSNRLRSNMNLNFQQRERSSSVILQPLDYDHSVERSRGQAQVSQSHSQSFQEDRMRPKSTTPKPLHFKP